MALAQVSFDLNRYLKMAQKFQKCSLYFSSYVDIYNQTFMSNYHPLSIHVNSKATVCSSIHSHFSSPMQINPFVRTYITRCYLCITYGFLFYAVGFPQTKECLICSANISSIPFYKFSVHKIGKFSLIEWICPRELILLCFQVCEIYTFK